MTLTVIKPPDYKSLSLELIDKIKPPYIHCECEATITTTFILSSVASRHVLFAGFSLAHSKLEFNHETLLVLLLLCGCDSIC